MVPYVITEGAGALVENLNLEVFHPLMPLSPAFAGDNLAVYKRPACDDGGADKPTEVVVLVSPTYTPLGTHVEKSRMRDGE